MSRDWAYVIGTAAMVFAASSFDWRAGLFLVGLLMWEASR